jgi:Protein of unknown function (DUF1524)
MAVAVAAVLTLGATGCEVTVGASPASPTPPADSLRQLNQLVIAAQGSMAGYRRDRFPHWRKTGDNCDVRDAVLVRDGTAVRFSGCNVVSGRWHSPYDGKALTDPSEVDVDHLVPLANAWRSGAARWDDARRADFANDLTRPQLVAVSVAANRAKGDQDPSLWRPANRDYWCEYAQDWIAVKHFWRLTVTTGERVALIDMLETCTWPSSRAP